MRVVILQPGYLPWIGFFDLIYKSDIFVILDDVQYTKRDWRSRNKIKTHHGIHWLSVPVKSKGAEKQTIREAKIDNQFSWKKKHVGALLHSYSRAEFFSLIFPYFEKIYDEEWKFLIDLDMALINVCCQILGLNPTIQFSSNLVVEGNKNEKILNICKHFGADIYLTGNKAIQYIDEKGFADARIALEYHNYRHPVYTQLWGTFVPFLSIVDLLFNHGFESLGYVIDNKANGKIPRLECCRGDEELVN